jgi:HD-GYP domain-containing protein (c-di-GMP phosphodiesterase class II)
MHLGNSLLVSGAAALHLELPFARVWRHNLMLDLVPHLALTLVGLAAAEIGISAPLLVPVLAIPAYLVHLAVRESVQLREETQLAVAALVEIVELRDPYTAGHSRRVAATAFEIALEVGLTAEEADVIRTAGSAHDIGKIVIDPAIVGKPGKLTESEWEEMQKHPAIGAEVLSRFSGYREGTAMVRGHHESFDGSGYPDALWADLIPIGARILAVADTFDALTSDRPYREGMSIARAREILAAGSGEQWDPAIVNALNRILDRDAVAHNVSFAQTTILPEVNQPAA